MRLGWSALVVAALCGIAGACGSRPDPDATVASAAAGARARSVNPPTTDDLADDPTRYVEDRAYRRAVLERDLTDRAPLYARQRLARYATDGAASWDRLPERQWRSAPLTVEDARRMAATGEVPADLDYTVVAAGDAADWPDAPQGWASLGERVFFEYPFAYAPPIGEALRYGADLKDYGLLVHDGAYVGVRVVASPTGPHLAVTCAVCHASIDEDGEPSAVRANRHYDFGRLRTEHGRAALEGGIDVTRAEHLASLGPGRSDVQVDDAFNPYAFPDLGGIADMPFLHHTANWHHRGVATLAIRVETVFTRAGPRGWRPPRPLMWALASYFRALPAPAPPREADELSDRGRAVFERENCNMCHAPPLYTSDEPVALDEIGTDMAAGTSAARGTGTWRVPSLRGVGGNAPYLHHGAFDTLEAMFAPGRTAREPGHEFGLDLDEPDRVALLAFLRTI